MFLDSLEPYRYNYFRKRIEIASEVVPIFKNSYLTQLKNVKLLVIYVNEPVLYLYKDTSKLIFSETVERMETPKKQGKLESIFEYFNFSLFFDLLICEFENMVLCMSRDDEKKAAISALISELSYEEADQMLKNPKLLVESYMFEEDENVLIEAEEEEQPENVAEANPSKEDGIKAEKKEDFDNNLPSLDKNTDHEIDEHGIFDEDKENIDVQNTMEKSNIIEVVSEKDEKPENKAIKKEKSEKTEKNVFSKISGRISKLFKNKKVNEKEKWEGEPGYFIFAKKTGKNVIITKKVKLKEPFLFNSPNDLKTIKDFVANEYFYVEIESCVRFFILKEEKIKIFLHTKLSENCEETIKNVARLTKLVKTKTQSSNIK